ncbi:putative GTP pyrophosphokinase [Amphibacillus marinus]|uniref:Putative GTP pyrophosphokinase n=2 Tax=Amphibacillus marinus TaxID=872970 RepID=A0A1H8QV50_9BACI|nr:putative GTP pyrophosphokinase [Amphibacillus marinus]
MSDQNLTQADLKEKKDNFMRFLMGYKFALSKINTTLDILKQEFQYIHDYNPIENVSSRIKSPDSIMKKAQKKGCDLNILSIKDQIRDIAGLRITCSFESDIYEIRDLLVNRKDIVIIEEKDYIKAPKGNGYRSLHLIISVPIYMSDREEHVFVEVQIRTIAMDFWASLEHKIYYKYHKEIPERIRIELSEAATVANQLDLKMEALHTEMNEIKASISADEDLEELQLENERFHLPFPFLNSLFNERLNSDNN